MCFPRPLQAAYHKHEQAASRFALVGVAVARFADTRFAGGAVRVAVTGLGQGVLRHEAAETALRGRWHADALHGVALDEEAAQGDIHASAAYRVHLAGVWCRRLVQRLTAVPDIPDAEAPSRPRTLPHRPETPPSPSLPAAPAPGPSGWLRRLLGR